MKVLIVAGDALLLRALLGAFRKRGHTSYGCTRADWILHASKLHSCAPFDCCVVGQEFHSGSKRKPVQTAMEFIAQFRAVDPLMPFVCMVREGESVPFGAAKVVGDPVIRRVVRVVEKKGPRQGSLLLQ